MGDPQELNGIARALCPSRQEPLLIGSTKSNMGHPEPASGLAALAKVGGLVWSHPACQARLCRGVPAIEAGQQGTSIGQVFTLAPCGSDPQLGKVKWLGRPQTGGPSLTPSFPPPLPLPPPVPQPPHQPVGAGWSVGRPSSGSFWVWWGLPDTLSSFGLTQESVCSSCEDRD